MLRLSGSCLQCFLPIPRAGTLSTGTQLAGYVYSCAEPRHRQWLCFDVDNVYVVKSSQAEAYLDLLGIPENPAKEKAVII